jgi:hypothetical protein
MDKRKTGIGACVVLLLLLAGAWAFGLFGGDAAIAKLLYLCQLMEENNLTYLYLF